MKKNVLSLVFSLILSLHAWGQKNSLFESDSNKRISYKKDFTEAQLYAGPEIVNAITGSDASKQLPLSGKLGLYFHQNYAAGNEFLGTNRIECNLNVNFATNTDSIRLSPRQGSKGFSGSDQNKVGTFLIRPVASLYATELDLKGYFHKPSFFGWHLGAFAGNSAVVFKTDTAKSASDTLGFISAGGVKAGAFIEFMFRKAVEDSISLKIGADGNYEGIFNDLGRSGNNNIRKQILGTEQASFWGVTVYAAFNYKNLGLSTSYINYIAHDHQGINGFTGGQFLVNVNVRLGTTLYSKFTDRQ
jgi:hypothetical protein